MINKFKTLAIEMLKNRREQAQIVAEENLQMALLSDGFKKEYYKQKELEFEIAKFEHHHKPTTVLKQKLSQTKKEMETELGKLEFTFSNLQPNYTCKKCSDTGLLPNGDVCGCFKKLMSEILLKNSGVSLDSLPSFENTKFEKVDKQQLSTYKTIYKKMQEYVNNLQTTSKKFVLFVGNTGVGKTHLAQCMVNQAVQNSVYTVYTTAFDLGEDLLKYHLASLYEKRAILSKYLECDFLVIDDLGTEPKYNNVTEEYLHLIISERLIYNRKTLITTNLSLEQIRDNYGERIFSRIANKDQTIMLKMEGKDLRLDI